MTDRKTRIEQLHASARKRILLLDGSWGVMFQKMGLSEDDYRNDHFTVDAYPGQRGDHLRQLYLPALLWRMRDHGEKGRRAGDKS